MTAAPVWAGGFVAESLDVRVSTDPARSIVPVETLVGMALRHNPRRAHLLVSTVLAKHVPTAPGLALAAGALLGALVSARLDAPSATPPKVPSWVPAEGAANEFRTLDAGGRAGASGSEGGGRREGDGDARLAALGARLAALVDAGPAGPSATDALRRAIAESAHGHPEAVVVGYAETATGLGRLVADHLGAYYLHSTRLAPSEVAAFAGFEEEHSHATSHRLHPADRDWLKPKGTVVLVDDELSTGATVVNTIRALHAVAPQARWCVASLVDLRSAKNRDAFRMLALELDTEIDAVALGVGAVSLPADVLARAGELLAGLPSARHVVGGTSQRRRAARVRVLDLAGAVEPVWSDRFGGPAARRDDLSAPLLAATARVAAARVAVAPVAGTVADAIAARLAPDIGADERVVVLGTEEFIALPLAVAAALAGRRDESAETTFSTTTRSPIRALERDDYAIATALPFDAHDTTDDGVMERFAYNLDRGGRRLDRVLVFPEPGSTAEALVAPGRLADALTSVADRVDIVLLPAAAPAVAPLAAGAPETAAPEVAAPETPKPKTAAPKAAAPETAAPETASLETTTGAPPVPEPLTSPAFGSYSPEDVGWLLQDLGDTPLEAPAAERERAIQSGRANYAESLPIEYVPSPEYQELYRDALDRSSRRVAQAVGVVTELALEARGGAPVLVSLARAGTPIGVLMRRWAQVVHGIDLPHYTMSIVRGVGIDTAALHWLAEHHDAAQVLFVDGWTGKGAIARELAAALAAFELETGIAFGREMAVLADPGHCVTLFGTRDDYLIPSACLNSTVSGLVSRTVYSEALIAPGDFHGAKFYRQLREDDVSVEFLDTVAAHFGDLSEAVADDLSALRATDRTPTWVGWQAVERLSVDYEINDVNLVKPGVGETTRVLLRRVPWKVLVRPDAVSEVAHVLLLAEQRGVVVETVDDLPYSCVGLIHPQAASGPAAEGAA